MSCHRDGKKGLPRMAGCTMRSKHCRLGFFATDPPKLPHKHHLLLITYLQNLYICLWKKRLTAESEETVFCSVGNIINSSKLQVKCTSFNMMNINQGKWVHLAYEICREFYGFFLDSDVNACEVVQGASGRTCFKSCFSVPTATKK